VGALADGAGAGVFVTRASLATGAGGGGAGGGEPAQPAAQAMNSVATETSRKSMAKS
jgi:hypothetical protein